jgi:hypothetical protein
MQPVMDGHEGVADGRVRLNLPSPRDRSSQTGESSANQKLRLRCAASRHGTRIASQHRCFAQPTSPARARYWLVFFTYKMLLPRQSLPRRNTVRSVNPSFLRYRCRSRLNVNGTFFANLSVAGLNSSFTACLALRSGSAFKAPEKCCLMKSRSRCTSGE